MRNLNIHKLLLKLNNLCEYLDHDYNINRGGCCYLAYIIAEYLERLDIKFDLVVYDNIKRNRPAIEHEVLTCNLNRYWDSSVTGLYTCNHYSLRIRGAGIVNPIDVEGDFEYIIPEASSRNIKWLYKKGRWNDEYLISHNKIVRRVVKKFFREYEAN